MNDHAKEIVNPEEGSIFFNAFEYASIGMALVAPDGKWLRVNRPLCEMRGYNGESQTLHGVGVMS